MGLMRQTAVWLAIVAATGACTEVPDYRPERGELFPGGKPVGQPRTSRQTDIRMVRVSSAAEADSFFAALCRKIPPGGRMTYTREVPPGTYEVGIIRIQDAAINAKGIREVHFVETVKPERKQPARHKEHHP